MPANSIGLGIIGSGRIGTLRARLASGHAAVAGIAVSDLDPANATKLATLVGGRSHGSDNQILQHFRIVHVELSFINANFHKFQFAIDGRLHHATPGIGSNLATREILLNLLHFLFHFAGLAHEFTHAAHIFECIKHAHLPASQSRRQIHPLTP